MRTFTVVVTGGLVVALGCTPKPEQKQGFSWCPDAQEFRCDWVDAPSQETPPPQLEANVGTAPLMVPGNWSPDGPTVACSAVPLHPGSRYHFGVGGTVSYSSFNPAAGLTFGPDGNQVPSTSPPFIKTRMANAGEQGTAAQYSLIFRAAKLGAWRALGTRYNHWAGPTGNTLNPDWWHYDDPANLQRQLCFAANDRLGTYGDNSGVYLVTIREQHQLCQCFPKPAEVITENDGGIIGSACGSSCSLSGKGVCGLGVLDCADGGKTCVQAKPKGPDTDCNNLDDDCNGKVDDGFVSAFCPLDPSPCQAGFVIDAGTQCSAGKTSCVNPHDYCECPFNGTITAGCGQCANSPCHTNRDCAPNLACRPTGTFAQNCADLTSTCACTPIVGCTSPKCTPLGAKGTVMDGCAPAQPICLSPGDTCGNTRDANCCFPLQCNNGKCVESGQCLPQGAACILTFDCCKGLSCKKNICAK